MAVSVFDLFKIGIGPSSSHTVGPMRAARLFAEGPKSTGHLQPTRRVKAEIYGSLGASGKGLGSDKAVLPGLLGETPDAVDTDAVPDFLAGIRATANVCLLGERKIAFDEKADLVFCRRERRTNGMRFPRACRESRGFWHWATPRRPTLHHTRRPARASSRAATGLWSRPSCRRRRSTACGWRRSAIARSRVSRRNCFPR
ncbi:MAG: hypothetical protein IPO58_01130 [Betaproteobacteria bacterium]|nr:hypothetical protein [Betaproteobacteria bacterium]